MIEETKEPGLVDEMSDVVQHEHEDETSKPEIFAAAIAISCHIGPACEIITDHCVGSRKPLATRFCDLTVPYIQDSLTLPPRMQCALLKSSRRQQNNSAVNSVKQCREKGKAVLEYSKAG